MSKKYLLYIHSDRFSTEERKSRLVNELLERYYNDNEKSPLLARIPELKTAAQIVPKNIQFCEHGYAKGLCRKAQCNRKNK